MKKNIRKSMKRTMTKSMKNYSICVSTSFSQGKLNLRGYSVLTDFSSLKRISKSLKTMDLQVPNAPIKTLIELMSNRNLLSQIENVDNTKFAFVPEDNELFQEYSDLLLQYICCLKGVTTLFEKTSVNHLSIYIGIDISDLSKTIFEGTIHKDDWTKEILNFQLN